MTSTADGRRVARIASNWLSTSHFLVKPRAGNLKVGDPPWTEPHDGLTLTTAPNKHETLNKNVQLVALHVKNVKKLTEVDGDANALRRQIRFVTNGSAENDFFF